MTSAGPTSFPTKRLKYVAPLRRATVGGDSEKPYVSLEDIVPWTGRLTADVTATTDSTSGRSSVEPQGAPRGSLSNRFEPGDVLFGKLRPYLAKVWVAEFSGRSTTEFVVMRPVDAEPSFLRYVCLSQDFVHAVNASTFGSKMPRAEWDYIGALPVPVPTPSLQRAITDYLDRETARIDALIAAKETTLRLLAEKRWAFITGAVTRGLAPDTPLRDSGISWLGEIPAHWETERAHWLFAERDERSPNGEEELLTVSHITGVTSRSEKNVNMFEAKTQEGYKLCQVGDLAINTLWAWMGAMGVAGMDGIVSPAYNVYRPLDRLEPMYVDAIVRLPLFAQEVARYSKGVWSSRLRLYPEAFFEIRFPVPPRAEQREIVREVTVRNRKLDDFAHAAKRTIDLLKERRASLISAAVTGRINVEAAA